MNEPTNEDLLALRIARHLPREPVLPADISARLAHARRLALSRRQSVVAVSRGSAALTPWWHRHLWAAVTLSTLALGGALTWMASEDEASAGFGPGWSYHSEAELNNTVLETQE